MEQWWHAWNIPFTELNDVNLGNVASIAIGFGDGNAPFSDTGEGTVFFDDITLGNGSAEDPFYDGSVYLEEDPFVNGYLGYPLFLKQGCPLIDANGGDYIDGEPYLLGKFSCVYLDPDTNEPRGIPDTNVVNIGFHYFDWDYGFGLLKADLYRDMLVNFNDFAVLAGGWLTTYDTNDLITMADEWLEVAEPNIQINISGDANTGFVEVGVSGYSSDTQRIFLYVDGQYAGEIFGFENGDTLGIDVSKLGGGEHQLKAIGVDSKCNVTCSNITYATFNCPLNYCLMSSHYEPNKPLYFSAFNSSIGDITVNAYANGANVVWSQTYSGDSISDSIPAEITKQYDFDYINFAPSGGGAAIMKTSAATDPKGPQAGDYKALIIIPDADLKKYRKNSIAAVAHALRIRVGKCQELDEGDATYDNVCEYILYNPIKYMYISAHGRYKLGGVLRTCVRLSDGRVVSMKKSDFTNPSDVPSWCKDLEDFWQIRTKSFYQIFSQTSFTTLEYAHFDVCYSGRLTINANNQLVEGQPGFFGDIYGNEGLDSDMSEALGMNRGVWYGNRGYQGWYDETELNEPNELPSDYQIWTEDMWDRLGLGHYVGDALAFTMLDSRINWGDPNGPVQNFRFKGQGEIDNIQLVGN